MRQAMKIESRKIYFLFLDSKFLINNPSIITKVLQGDLETLPEGRVSQNFDLGSR